MHFTDYAILAVLVGWFVFCVVFLLRQRRKGKMLCGCGGDCGGCTAGCRACRDCDKK